MRRRPGLRDDSQFPWYGVMPAGDFTLGLRWNTFYRENIFSLCDVWVSVCTAVAGDLDLVRLSCCTLHL